MTWMFSNEYKTLFVKCLESGCVGYVIDTWKKPYVRFATQDDMVTNQYDRARMVGNVYFS